jgi:ABC-2 type transport system permease protein
MFGSIQVTAGLLLLGVVYFILGYLLFAVVSLALRLCITGVPTWQLAASMGTLIASVLGGLWIAAKLLRIYLLMYGKRPRLREIVRALRAG